ncbi:lipoprotein LpqH [candidate division WWE3 bacterium]|nr:lipoprotein LpqH [candidate division WWE3 bacterium]
MQVNRQSLPGLLLVGFGLLFLAEQLGLIASFDLGEIIGTYWPIILIYFGIRSLQQGRTNSGLILSTIGLFFLASTLFNVNVWNLFWPLLLIGAGFMLITKRPIGVVGTTISKISQQDTLNESVSFGSLEKKIESSQFNGGRVDASFGSVELDLSSVKIADAGAEIIANSSFGSIELKMPQNVRVESLGTPTLGSWENHAATATNDGPTITVRGTATFGSVEIHQ